jgi:hypothetical protein
MSPFSTAGMKLRGIEPPTMLSTNLNPPPRAFGANLICASPYWPWPPDCFLCRPRTSDMPLIVSL